MQGENDRPAIRLWDFNFTKKEMRLLFYVLLFYVLSVISLYEFANLDPKYFS